MENLDYLEDLTDEQLNAEMRMKNLMWTVSGNYKLDTKLDAGAYKRSKYIAMYDAIRQGAFDRFFDRDAFGMYILKKIYYGADEKALTSLAQLVVDEASWYKLLPERPGVREVRRQAFEYLLDSCFASLNETLPGKIQLVLIRGELTGDWAAEKKLSDAVDLIRACRNYGGTFSLIWTLDRIYNSVIDKGFVKNHGDLWFVLDTPLEDMKEMNWRDFLGEEAAAERMEELLSQIEEKVTAFNPDEAPKEPEGGGSQTEKGGKRVVVVDAAAAAKMYTYIEKNYGKSYLSEAEQDYMNRRLCKGVHSDCLLYYTEGIVNAPVLVNAQYVRAKQHVANNQRAFINSHNLVNRNVELMTAALKQALFLRSQTERLTADHGTVIPNRLWRVGRTEDPGKLFYMMTKSLSNDYAIGILMDGSGSQHDRQAAVAIQAYIIADSLSNVGIPHAVSSFCTFWDYTVMQKFRGWDDPKEKDRKILEFQTSANNRDGLAIRAAGFSLASRPEANKILIVLSDGRPNDIIVNRPGSRNPQPYYGDIGVNDTAFEIRRLREAGVSVLGVFTGIESDLPAEQKIFGRDFAYIRDIRNFSKVVSRYIVRLMEQDTGEV